MEQKCPALNLGKLYGPKCFMRRALKPHLKLAENSALAVHAYACLSLMTCYGQQKQLNLFVHGKPKYMMIK